MEIIIPWLLMLALVGAQFAPLPPLPKDIVHVEVIPVEPP
jgi:hypothetical protein